jgi:hypothetical protein
VIYELGDKLCNKEANDIVRDSLSEVGMEEKKKCGLETIPFKSLAL